MFPLIVSALLTITVTTNAPQEAPLIPGAVAMKEPGRYKSIRTYDDTVLYYQRYFRSRGGVSWHNIVNLPSVKAKHIKSLKKMTPWAGINIYETKGEVRIFIVPRSIKLASP
tara:strand:- start:253 stop:588 length:336 start_codon:yes stop_codon:yes gene_type:complete